MWENLPIVIKRRVGQRIGTNLPSSQKSERGIEIIGARDFEVGDPPRAIDRRHFAKFGKLIVLEKHPDKNAMILFLVDISMSEMIGSLKRKHEVNLELLCGLSIACLAKGHSVMFVAFTDSIEFESSVIRDRNIIERVLDELGQIEPQSRKTDPTEAFSRAWELGRRETSPIDLVLIVSDFLFSKKWQEDISLLYDVADVIAVVFQDRIETDLPPIAGGLMIRDSETGETFFASSAKNDEDPIYLLDKLGIDCCVLQTANEEDYYLTLKDFFEARAGERR